MVKNRNPALDKIYIRLNQVLREKGVTLSSLADDLGISVQSLSLSCEKKSLKLERLFEIERILKSKIIYSRYDADVQNLETIYRERCESLEGMLAEALRKIPEPSIKSTKKTIPTTAGSTNKTSK